MCYLFVRVYVQISSLYECLSEHTSICLLKCWSSKTKIEIIVGAIKEKEKEGVVIPYLHSCFAFVYSSRLGYYYGV